LSLLPSGYTRNGLEVYYRAGKGAGDAFDALDLGDNQLAQ
jgi:hypothetical protein